MLITFGRCRNEVYFPALPRNDIRPQRVDVARLRHIPHGGMFLTTYMTPL